MKNKLFLKSNVVTLQVFRKTECISAFLKLLKFLLSVRKKSVTAAVSFRLLLIIIHVASLAITDDCMLC